MRRDGLQSRQVINLERPAKTVPSERSENEPGYTNQAENDRQVRAVRDRQLEPAVLLVIALDALGGQAQPAATKNGET